MPSRTPGYPGCLAGRIRTHTRENHPRAPELVELDPSSTWRALVFRKQSREATGTGRRGVSPRAYPWGCNHNGCSGAFQFLPSKCLCRLDRGPIRQFQQWRTLNACLQSGFETFPATRFHGTLNEIKVFQGGVLDDGFPCFRTADAKAEQWLPPRRPPQDNPQFCHRRYCLLYWSRARLPDWHSFGPNFCAVLAPERRPVLCPACDASTAVVDFHSRCFSSTYRSRGAHRNAGRPIARRLRDQLLGRRAQCLRRAAHPCRTSVVRKHSKGDGLCFHYRVCEPGRLLLWRSLRSDSWWRFHRKLRTVLGALVCVQRPGEPDAGANCDDPS